MCRKKNWHFENILGKATCPVKICFLEFCDKSRFESLVEEQIALVGGESVFQKIHEGMTTEVYETGFYPYFIKEICDLYDYRVKFINELVPDEGGYSKNKTI